jgi:glycosyltransferase involved in cell wall biosynthesis
MLNQITPLILTYNEAPNLGRTLDRLAWARDIVIVDSLSTDDTRAIAARYPSVRVFDRAFTSHAEQWNFGLEQTGIKTDWVLALDADFVLTEDVIREIGALSPPPRRRRVSRLFHLLH